MLFHLRSYDSVFNWRSAAGLDIGDALLPHDLVPYVPLLRQALEEDSVENIFIGLSLELRLSAIGFLAWSLIRAYDDSAAGRYVENYKCALDYAFTNSQHLCSIYSACRDYAINAGMVLRVRRDCHYLVEHYLEDIKMLCIFELINILKFNCDTYWRSINNFVCSNNSNQITKEGNVDVDSKALRGKAMPLSPLYTDPVFEEEAVAMQLCDATFMDRNALDRARAFTDTQDAGAYYGDKVFAPINSLVYRDNVQVGQVTYSCNPMTFAPPLEYLRVYDVNTKQYHVYCAYKCTHLPVVNKMKMCLLPLQPGDKLVSYTTLLQFKFCRREITVDDIMATNLQVGGRVAYVNITSNRLYTVSGAYSHHKLVEKLTHNETMVSFSAEEHPKYLVIKLVVERETAYLPSNEKIKVLGDSGSVHLLDYLLPLQNMRNTLEVLEISKLFNTSVYQLIETFVKMVNVDAAPGSLAAIALDTLLTHFNCNASFAIKGSSVKPIHTRDSVEKCVKFGYYILQQLKAELDEERRIKIFRLYEKLEKYEGFVLSRDWKNSFAMIVDSQPSYMSTKTDIAIKDAISQN